MKRMFASIVLSLAASCAMAVESTEPVEVALSWRATVGADGQLAALVPADDLNPQLYKRFEADVRGWHFTPGKINGVPSATDTTLTVQIRLTPISGGFRPEILDAVSGVGYGKMVAPKYPDGALKSHRGGGVLLRVTFDGEGNVMEADTIDGGFPVAGEDIQRAARAAMKRWTFHPESIGGRGYGGRAFVPICFSALPEPSSDCRFVIPGSTTNVRDGSLLAVDPLVRIERPPAS